MTTQSHASHGAQSHGQTHTLSVLVENKPGVLARVAALFSRRGFNIESLAVGPTEYAEISRITLVVNVLKIVELEQAASVHRELILVKVRADAAERHQVLATIEPFGARVVDVSVDSLVVESTGDSAKLEAMLRVLEPFGIKELVQSGMVAIGRGPRSITDRTLRSVERAA